jgi:hypothetical protein
MPRTLVCALFTTLAGCGARTALDDGVATDSIDAGSTVPDCPPSDVACFAAHSGAIDAGVSEEGADASGLPPSGVLCALVDGIVSSCDAPERAGPVQRCEASEQCMPQMIPNADIGYHTVYECCVGGAGKMVCFTRQFNASYVCQ